MSRLVVAALVLLMTVGALVGAATWNRAGDAQVMVLSDRELTVLHRDASGAEVRLRIEWQRRDDPQDARAWLTEVKLREIGFTTGVPAGAPEAETFYGRSLPRLAWVALELAGPAWRAIEQRREMRRESVPREPVAPGPSSPERAFALPWGQSRLVPIDAAPTPEVLRRRYQGMEVLVLPAIIRMRYRTSPTEGPSVWGEVSSLVTEDVSVPARLRGHLPRRSRTPGGDAPRYRATLRVGRLGLVWVESIED